MHERSRSQLEQGRHELPVLHLVEDDPRLKANSAVLAGVYAVLFGEMTPEEAWSAISQLEPFAQFRDASVGSSSYHITVLDCVRAMHAAACVGLVDFHTENPSIPIKDHAHYEKLEHGDLTWVVPRKALAFSGPLERRTKMNGLKTHIPEDYWEYFKRHNISAIVRLNNKVYDSKRWTNGGFRCYELFFADGSTPPESILTRFFEIMEREPGAVAVHCKAGLGRTGTLLGCYCMHHYGLTANQAIAYLRMCRPGSVIGAQQRWLQEAEAYLCSPSVYLPSGPVSSSRFANTESGDDDNADNTAVYSPCSISKNEHHQQRASTAVAAAAAAAAAANVSHAQLAAKSPAKWANRIASSERKWKSSQQPGSSKAKRPMRSISTSYSRRVVPGSLVSADATANQQQHNIAAVSHSAVSRGTSNSSSSSTSSSPRSRGSRHSLVSALQARCEHGRNNS